jgi:hypothetical protein
MRMRRVSLLSGAALAVFLILFVSSPVLANGRDGHRCTTETLDGLYVFAASGFIVPAMGPAQPKAIVELIRFHGDGTLDVPGATRSLNGVIGQVPPGGTGTYTVANLVPPDGACLGTLTFTDGPSFDLFIPINGEKIRMIQTNPNNVFEGTVTRIAR